MKKTVITALAALSLSAHAEFMDGNILLQRLTGTEQQQALGVGYIIGSTDTLMGLTVCAPANVTASQLTDMVTAFLKANPAVRHKTADSIVNYLFSTAWPCEQKKKGPNT